MFLTPVKTLSVRSWCLMSTNESTGPTTKIVMESLFDIRPQTCVHVDHQRTIDSSPSHPVLVMMYCAFSNESDSPPCHVFPCSAIMLFPVMWLVIFSLSCDCVYLYSPTNTWLTCWWYVVIPQWFSSGPFPCPVTIPNSLTPKKTLRCFGVPSPYQMTWRRKRPSVVGVSWPATRSLLVSHHDSHVQ